MSNFSVRYTCVASGHNLKYYINSSRTIFLRIEGHFADVGDHVYSQVPTYFIFGHITKNVCFFLHLIN